MKKILLSTNYLKKYLKSKGFTVIQKKNVKDKINFQNIFRTFLSSLIIILFFFISPLIINFTKEQIIFLNYFLNYFHSL